jgi:hypothetical protein
MAVPTVEEVQARSQVDFAELGFGETAALQQLIDEAVALLPTLTGRSWSPPAMPVNLEPLAKLAIVKMVEVEAYQSQPDYIETASDDVVQSFSAGSYSETRVDPLKRAAAKVLTAHPGLAGLLWRIMTPDLADYWTDFLAGVDAPASEVTEVDWSETMGPYESLPGTWW